MSSNFDGIDQDANATVSAGGAATINLTNTNSMTLALNATASGNTSANAKAFYDGDVIAQRAVGTAASAGLANGTGATMLMAGDANANATEGFAGAYAEFDANNIDQAERLGRMQADLVKSVMSAMQREVDALSSDDD